MAVEDINRFFDTHAKTFELYRNYRLPQSVAKIVQYVGVDLDGFDIDTYKSRETVVPRFIQYDDFREQIDAITRVIKSGIVSDVAILVPHNEDVRRVHSLLNAASINHELKYEDKEDFRSSINNLDFTTDNPKVMTYHSAKGLQFETVILPSFTFAKGMTEQKTQYVAMTRTYRNLYVMYQTAEMPFYKPIPAHLYKPNL